MFLRHQSLMCRTHPDGRLPTLILRHSNGSAALNNHFTGITQSLLVSTQLRPEWTYYLVDGPNYISLDYKVISLMREVQH